jgi:hypothetical protein
MKFNRVATPRDTATTPAAHLIRRIGDLEVPAAGTWDIVPASHVGLTIEGRRDAPARATIIDGALRVGRDPEHSELRLAFAGPDTMSLVGRSTMVEADPHGTSKWSIGGTLTSGGCAEPVQLALTYHGVFRSAGRSWAWFSGAGTVGTPRRLSPWRRSPAAGQRLIVLDLLFDSPAVLIRSNDTRQAA